MNTFDPKAEADALLASLAAAGNGEEMAVSVRKAAWAAAKAAPIELISRAAKEPTVHQYKEGEKKGAGMIRVMAERHLAINAGRERLNLYPAR